MAYHRPHKKTQEKLNDLDLSENKAELLGSRLQQWNLLEDDVTTTTFISKAPFFRKEGNLVFCLDIEGLMNALDITYYPEEWGLFVDSSISNLKVMLLHIENRLPSIFSSQPRFTFTDNVAL